MVTLNGNILNLAAYHITTHSKGKKSREKKKAEEKILREKIAILERDKICLEFEKGLLQAEKNRLNQTINRVARGEVGLQITGIRSTQV